MVRDGSSRVICSMQNICPSKRSSRAKCQTIPRFFPPLSERIKFFLGRIASIRARDRSLQLIDGNRMLIDNCYSLSFFFLSSPSSPLEFIRNRNFSRINSKWLLFETDRIESNRIASQFILCLDRRKKERERENDTSLDRDERNGVSTRASRS